MAKCKFGMMMTDARGKLGGHVFTKNKSGAVIRTKVTPSNPKTDAQAASRSALGVNSARWSNITEEQRNGWNSRALANPKTNIFGDTYFASGKNLFVGVNANLASVGLPQVAAADTDLGPGGIVTLVVEYGFSLLVQNTLKIEPVLTIADPNAILVYMVTPPKSAGTYNFSGRYVQLAYAPIDDLLNEEDLADLYIAKFGKPQIGEKIGASVHTISSAGYKSVSAQGSCIVELIP